MLGNLLWNRKRSKRLLLVASPIFAFILTSLWYAHHASAPHAVYTGASEKLPLLKKYIDQAHGEGGRWVIPQSWLDEAFAADKAPLPVPTTVLEAANLALDLAIRGNRMLAHSKIPLIVHQSWRNTDTPSWQPQIQERVEGWLNTAIAPHSDAAEMAYIYWDDAGVDSLIHEYEPNFARLFDRLPVAIEKADTFRIAVVKWFGGVYVDIDTKPLQHPSLWIHESDLTPWTDPLTLTTHALYTTTHPSYTAPAASPPKYQRALSHYPHHTNPTIGAIVGLECDSPPDTSAYWRMGYHFPVQLTNWAFAFAPQHPLATTYLTSLAAAIHANASRLAEVDPLDLTGPPALTAAAMTHCQSEDEQFRWDALSGLDDAPGGRGKVSAGDVLVLPITGFSPERGRWHNMGSKGEKHEQARLRHDAFGSWRREGGWVVAGKLCRTVLGMCRDWSKVS